ncbi:eukaryotic membrane protein [Dictyocaulus viviparus]|uniref:Eukaryotic membrane protein n=1 Tax=Dictyocaulus viviparus TaxID=29172 RepID=A0A0D8XWZ3_DICVI|nr:eukaryotic membrane protein [Dictyocaulus viviparus]
MISDEGVRSRKGRHDSRSSEGFTIGSDLEDDPNSSSYRPSHVSITENLTIFCDDDEELLLSNENDEKNLLLLKPTYGFFQYCWSELTSNCISTFFRGYSLHNDQTRYTEKRRKVYAFLRIPIEVERFLFYGLLQCIDAFCYLFTFLPIRFFTSIFGFVFRLRPWTSAETCDFFKVWIIVFGSILMQHIDTSVVYHQVRGQGVIKLYIFYNMLEVADKLFSSLGQDILDALFWTANEPKTFRSILRTLCHFAFAMSYASIHTFLVLLQATTLNVAFNSHNQALLAIMMSNNFVELKGSVFKKFAKANLFQMACRHSKFFFLVVAWNRIIHNQMFQLMVFGAELLVDWLKHAFITKFNEINAEVYRDFTITIAYDVVRSRDSSAFSDYSDQVSRRMGFIPIPLSIMLIRVLSQSLSLQGKTSIVICVLAWLLMLAIKICNGIVLLGKACAHVNAYKELQARAEYELFRKRMVGKKSKSAPSSPRISLIDFSDVLHQPVGVKGFTVSDLMSQWEDLEIASQRRSNEREREERLSRRAQSFAHISRARRDKSEPPPSIPEGEEKSFKDESLHSTERRDKDKEKNDVNQCSPRKKPVSATNCDVLADVTAYTMLPPEQGVERIE